jgi:putative transposase
MLSNLPALVKKILGHLPDNDYPKLSTKRFVALWLNYVLDPGIESMRGLFQQLNWQGVEIDISTFSKASNHRDVTVFQKIFQELNRELKRKNASKAIGFFPVDSTIVTLTSKLLWTLGIHQVKLFAGLDSLTGEIEGVNVHFGNGHDSKYGEETLDATPENRVLMMDRGFCKLERIAKLLREENRYFLMRLNTNTSLEFQEDGSCRIGKKAKIVARTIIFQDEKGQEYRLVTNLPKSGENAFTDEEVKELYRHRWRIELLWKFLKMHLKLDRIITKNINGITIQIYTSLIAYLFLQLLEVASFLVEKILDKFRCLLSFMKSEKSFVHWFDKLALSR